MNALAEAIKFKPARLSDKAMQVKLTVRRATTQRRDDALTATVQAQNNDTSLTVLTKLFRNKESLIYKIGQAINTVYAEHIKRTSPYLDGGYRLLKGSNYMEYTQEMRHLMGVVDTLVKQAMPIYDTLVQQDISYRNQGLTNGRASVADYPTAEQFEKRVSFDLAFRPLPDEDHPLFDLSPEDRQAFADDIARVEHAVKTDTINRMLEPLRHLVARLREYKGEKGERFHLSNIENVVEGCRAARSLLLDQDEELLGEIADLERVANGYIFNASMLKEDQTTRDLAAAKLEEAAKKMAAYFG